MLLGSRLSSRLAGRHLEKSVLCISCLVCSILQTHMLAFLAKTLNQNVSKINSFDFAKWDGGGFRFLLLSWIALEKMQSKWQLSFPSQEVFWTKRKLFCVKSP